uniref:Uncharacterized protein n=1 Tax=Brassica oleracea var. oleracea TaxID=109376 RepID=A0A0D3CT87_BRAOL
MLGTASPWLGQSLVVFDVVFLVVSLPSIVNVRLGFQDLVFGVYAIFHSSRTAPKFADFVLSLFPSLFSHLVTASHLWWFSLSPCLSFEVDGVSFLEFWYLLSRNLWVFTCMDV